MADLGYIVVLLALAFALYSAFAAVLGARWGRPELTASARNAAYAVLGLVTVAGIALFYSFAAGDYSVKYVAAYSSRDMSLLYKLASFWAGNEGSLLFWSWSVAIMTGVLLWQNRRTHRELLPYILAVIMVVEAFFLFLMVFLTNPFDRYLFTPADGRGLNPLLENMGMFFHPPTLLLGYAGFAIPFAFAVAALITGRLGDEWVRSIRRWTLVTWLFLAVGNLFGSQWAYVELGWGGYWGWDPVENASFMPLLVGTAFLHSIMVQKRRGMLKVWNIVLVIITFNLSLLGTFLTRSGVLSSVHSFGQSSLGPFFVGFIGLSLAFSVGLLLYRLPKLKSENELDSFLSREASFLVNNLILVGITFAVFLGSMFPLISEAVRHVKVTVGPPFFNQVTGPIFLVLIVVMGVCPLIGWRKATPNNLIRNFLYPLGVALVLAVVLFLLGMRQIYALLAFAICAFVAATIILEWWRGTRSRHKMRHQNYLAAFFGLLLANKARYGGYIVHLGVILVAVGVIGSYAFKAEAEATLKPKETMTIRNYTLRYEGISEYETASRAVKTASVTVLNGGKRVAIMAPAKTFHANYDQAVSEVAIRSTPKEDLYVILMGWEEDGSDAASFKVLVNPLVLWIWIGGALVLGGTFYALWGRQE